MCQRWQFDRFDLDLEYFKHDGNIWNSAYACHFNNEQHLSQP